MTPGHGELSHDAAGYALGILEPEECLAFEAHLATCAECLAEVRALRLAATSLAHAVPLVSPRLSLRAKVVGSVRHLDGAPVGTGSDHTARGSAVSDAAAPRTTASVTRWLTVAAGLAATVGLTVNSFRQQSSITALEAQLGSALAQLASSERQAAEARVLAVRSQSAMGVLAAVDVARIDLAGQAVAQDARARALWSRQRGMVFTVSNLPPLPAGRVYQVWVVTAAAPVSAGLLIPDATGGASVFFETPIDILPPVALAVTLEPAGGVPAPTGERYLIGTPAPL